MFTEHETFFPHPIKSPCCLGTFSWSINHFYDSLQTMTWVCHNYSSHWMHGNLTTGMYFAMQMVRSFSEIVCNEQHMCIYWILYAVVCAGTHQYNILALLIWSLLIALRALDISSACHILVMMCMSTIVGKRRCWTFQTSEISPKSAHALMRVMRLLLPHLAQLNNWILTWIKVTQSYYSQIPIREISF